MNTVVVNTMNASLWHYWTSRALKWYFLMIVQSTKYDSSCPFDHHALNKYNSWLEYQFNFLHFQIRKNHRKRNNLFDFSLLSGIMTLTSSPCELDNMSLFQDLKLKRRKVDSRCSSDGENKTLFYLQSVPKVILMQQITKNPTMSTKSIRA